MSFTNITQPESVNPAWRAGPTTIFDVPARESPCLETFKEPRNRFRGVDFASLFTVAWRASTTNMVVVPVRHAGNRFLGSLKVHKIENFFGSEFEFYTISL